MLANNMEKLGMLALVQESMKGFPDGIPAIAESVMAGLQGGGAEEMPQGKFGGLMKAQAGGTLLPGTSLNINGKTVKVKSVYSGITGKDWVKFEKPIILKNSRGENVKIEELTLEDIQKAQSQDVQLGADKGWFNSGYRNIQSLSGSDVSAAPLSGIEKLGDKIFNYGYPTVALRIGTLPKQSTYKVGDILYKNNVKYKVVDPAVHNYSGKPLLELEELDDPNTFIQSWGNATGKRKTVSYDQIGTFTSLTKSGVSNTSQKEEKVPNDLNQQSIYTNKQKAQTRDGEPLTVGQYKDNKWYNVYTGLPVDWKPQGFETDTNKAKPAVKQTATKPATPKPAVKPKTYSEVLSLFAMGGQLPEYQQGAEAKTTQPETETLAGTYTLPDGKVAYVYYTATEKIVKDVNGNVQDRAPRTDKAAYAPHKGDVNPSTNPITGQKETGWNKSKYTADQIDALARERGYTGPKNNKALQQWILSKPEFSKVVEELHAKYKIPAAGIKDDGFWGVRWDDILEKIPSVPSTTTTPAPVTGAQQPVTPKEDFVVPEPAMPQAPKTGPWWLQDITNFVGTLTDDINRYEPTQGRVALQTPGYVTLDPTRRLAANQEQFARMQQMTENTVDGNVGLASMTGTQGQSFANAANVLGDVENANVGIVNQAYNTNAQIMNQEAAANEVGRQKYVEDMATLNQQLDNSEQQNKWRQIAAFNNGTTNWFRKKQMEQILFPDVYVDPILGDVSIDPSGRSLFGPDTYSPSYMDNRGGNNMMSGNAGIEEWNAIVQEATPIMGPEEAKKYATMYMGNQMRAQNRAVTGLTPRQQYNQMAIQGLTLPLPPREFGGVVYFPWSDIE
jgi:hypothetical protein